MQENDSSDLTRDEAALKMFDHPYGKLSAWGQAHVDQVLAKFAKADEPHTPTVEEHRTLEQDNERLAKELEDQKLENLSLWEQLDDARTETEEMRDELHELHKDNPSRRTDDGQV